DRRLIDLEHAVDASRAFDRVAAGERGLPAARSARREQALQVVAQHVTHERALAAAADAGHANETLERHGNVDALQVVTPRAANHERVVLLRVDLPNTGLSTRCARAANARRAPIRRR